MTVLHKARVPAEDLWYGTHRPSMNTNVLLQHLDPGQVRSCDPLALRCNRARYEEELKRDGPCR